MISSSLYLSVSAVVCPSGPGLWLPIWFTCLISLCTIVAYMERPIFSSLLFHMQSRTCRDTRTNNGPGHAQTPDITRPTCTMLPHAWITVLYALRTNYRSGMLFTWAGKALTSMCLCLKNNWLHLQPVERVMWLGLKEWIEKKSLKILICIWKYHQWECFFFSMLCLTCSLCPCFI